MPKRSRTSEYQVTSSDASSETLPSIPLWELDRTARDGTSMYDSMERRTSVGRSSKEEEDEDGGVSFVIFSLSLVDQFSYCPIMDRRPGRRRSPHDPGVCEAKHVLRVLSFCSLLKEKKGALTSSLFLGGVVYFAHVLCKS